MKSPRSVQAESPTTSRGEEGSTQVPSQYKQRKTQHEYQVSTSRNTQHLAGRGRLNADTRSVQAEIPNTSRGKEDSTQIPNQCKRRKTQRRYLRSHTSD